MTPALGVEPVTLSLLIGVVDVAGERFWRRRGCCRRNGGFDGRGRGLSGRGHMLADQRRFADPFFDRLVPDQRDQRGGEDEFEEEAHGGGQVVIGYWVISYQSMPDYGLEESAGALGGADLHARKRNLHARGTELHALGIVCTGFRVS